MAENSVYLSKKDPQEKKGPEAEERTEPYSCTVHNSVSFVRFPFRPLAPMYEEWLFLVFIFSNRLPSGGSTHGYRVSLVAHAA